MIEIRGLNKSFGENQVLRNIDMDIKDGEIYGIVGKSGVGKSTLLRCINLLETPDSGTIVVNGTNTGELSGKEAREYQKTAGMVFQHFSLMNRRTVRENIALPLKFWGWKKRDIDERVNQLAKLVGIAEKIDEKPENLSGGQKQRVAIARALAPNPEILLCDEATSSLDPVTTDMILDLLKEINSRMGITIVIVTHQMEVVKKICERVSIMQGGQIAETGAVEDVFLSNHQTIRRFLGESPVKLPKENRNLEIILKEGQFQQLSQLICYLDGRASIVSSNIETFRERQFMQTILNVKDQDFQVCKNWLRNNGIQWKEVC